MDDPASIIIAIVCIAAFLALLAAFFWPKRKANPQVLAALRATAQKVIPFLHENFDALADADGKITTKSLLAALPNMPEHNAEISMIVAYMGKFGNKVDDTSDEVKGATGMELGAVSPQQTPLAFVEGGHYEISKAYAKKICEVKVDDYGVVHVFVLD
jgi:hypothetical protein